MAMFDAVFEKVCPGKERNETNLAKAAATLTRLA